LTQKTNDTAAMVENLKAELQAMHDALHQAQQQNESFHDVKMQLIGMLLHFTVA
jgi:hypothetical protein